MRKYCIVRSDITFAGLAAWHYPGGETCVIMGHGLGATRAAGLAPYAERFCAAGHQVLVFDYRHMGDSQGQPRQLMSIPRQLEDWRSAVNYARTLPGVRRIILWGTSFGGGHVITTASRERVDGVMAQCPMMDGQAAFLQAVRRVGLWALAQVATWALLDALRGLLGRPPLMLPIAAPPGKLGFLSAPDSLPGFLRLSPPNVRNELAARLALTTGMYRPVLVASRIQCPVLIQICTQDTVAPPEAAEECARRCNAQVARYPIGHFDVYFDEHFERSVGDQLEFLARL